MPFAPLNNITTWYKETGSGTALPIVFANSLGTDHRIWDGVTDRLAADRRCIVYDKRGHGASALSPAPYAIADLANDLLALADHCGVDRFIICGVSVGGMIAMAAAAAAPERVAGLVLCDTASTIGTPALWNSRIAQVRDGGMASITEAVMTRWFSLGFQHDQAPAMGGWANVLERTPAEGYIATCAAIRDADLTAAAKAIAVPTLVVAGEDDQATPPEQVRALAGQISGAQFVSLPGIGHIPSIEQPDKLAELIGRFLETLPHE